MWLEWKTSEVENLWNGEAVKIERNRKPQMRRVEDLKRAGRFKW